MVYVNYYISRIALCVVQSKKHVVITFFGTSTTVYGVAMGRGVCRGRLLRLRTSNIQIILRVHHTTRGERGGSVQSFHIYSDWNQIVSYKEFILTCLSKLTQILNI
jgi:hypothetical protein